MSAGIAAGGARSSAHSHRAALNAGNSFLSQIVSFREKLAANKLTSYFGLGEENSGLKYPFLRIARRR